MGILTFAQKKRNKTSINYLNVLHANGLINTINDYTREEISAGELKSGCLDHINIRLKKTNNFYSFIIKSKVADHFFVGCSIDLRNENAYLTKLKSTKRTKTVLSTEKIREEINNINWENFIEISDPIDYYSRIKNNFEQIYKKSEKKIKYNELDNIKPWISDKIKKLIKEKENCFNLWKVQKKRSYFKRKICSYT